MNRANRHISGLLIILLLLVLITAIAWGAVPIRLQEMFLALQHWINGDKPGSIGEAVFLQIRLPRVLLCAITGSILGVSGVLMQGLFRNPIVEPGLAGTSAGAAFGASIVFVFSASFNKDIQELAGPMLVPVFAFAGGWIATWIVYGLAGAQRPGNITTLLLIGIAVNALALSGTGFMSYMARDPQARSITFWNLGGFNGASWLQVQIVGIAGIAGYLPGRRYARGLNALMLGEKEAAYTGVHVGRMKRNLLLCNTAMVSVATAFCGVIGFMGLIVPHLMRLLIGSEHRRLLPASAICGAVLLTLADMGARLLLAPAEVPVGIITSLVGAPLFVWLLKRTRILVQKGGEL
jgi:iron complex transport system permease protein